MDVTVVQVSGVRQDAHLTLQAFSSSTNTHDPTTRTPAPNLKTRILPVLPQAHRPNIVFNYRQIRRHETSSEKPRAKPSDADLSVSHSPSFRSCARLRLDHRFGGLARGSPSRRISWAAMSTVL